MIKIITTALMLSSCSGAGPYQQTAEGKYKTCYHQKKDLVDSVSKRCIDDGGSPKSCLTQALKWTCGN